MAILKVTQSNPFTDYHGTAATDQNFDPISIVGATVEFKLGGVTAYSYVAPSDTESLAGVPVISLTAEEINALLPIDHDYIILVTWPNTDFLQTESGVFRVFRVDGTQGFVDPSASSDAKIAYDALPSAADDVEAEYYVLLKKEVPGGDLSDIGANKTQMVRIYDFVGGTPTVPVSGTFSALMLADNQTIASYVSNFPDAIDRHYAVIDGSTPTLSTDGVAAAASGTVDLGDYDPHSLTLWTYLTDTWTQRTPEINDGLDGFAIRGVYLLAPPAITDLAIATPVAGSGELDITFTAPTVVDGMASTIAYVTRTDTGEDANVYTGVTSPATLGNLPIGIELSVTVVVTATNGEVSVSNIAIETIPASTSSDYDGEIYIVVAADAITDQTVDGITRYQAVEASPVKFTIGLRNRQTTSADKTSVTVEVQTLNDTALEPTNYDALSTQTVTFTLDGTTDDLVVEQNVDTNDNDEPEHNAFQFQIIPGSVSAVGGDPATGTISAVLTDQAVMGYILGTGGPSATAFAISNTLTDTIESNKTGFILNATDFTSKSSGAATGSEDLTQYALATTVNEMTYLAGNNFDHMGSEDTNYPYSSDPALSYKVTAPRLDFECDFGTGNQGTYWLYARVYSNANFRNALWLGIDGSAVWSSGESTEVRLGSSSFDRWDWAPVKDALGNRVTYTVTSDGIKTFNVWKNDRNVWFDRFLLVNSETFDPSAHGTAGTSGGTPDAYGDDQNDKVAGTAITDNPNNGTITNPVPPTGVLVPTFNPLDGATGVGTTATITLTFETGANAIEVTGGNAGFVESGVLDPYPVVNGTVTVSDNVLTWTPVSRAENTEYKIIAEGTVKDNAGVVKNWSITTGDLDFTTVNPAAGTVILTLNPSQWAAPHAMTSDEVRAWIGTAGATRTIANIDAGRIRNVIDPFGSSEKVWRIQFDAGSTADLNGGFLLDYPFTPVEEIYWMTEMALCNQASDGVDWLSPAGMHMAMMRNAGSFSATTTKTPDGWAAFHQLLGNNSYIDSVWQIADGTDGPYKNTTLQDNNLTAYMYTQQGFQQNWYPDPLNITQRSNTNVVNAPVWKPGQYVRKEFFMKLNTVISPTETAADAEFKMWVDGVLVMDMSGFRFRGAGASASKQIDRGQFQLWSGGPVGDVKYAHPHQQYAYIKNFIVSTDPISHG